MASALIEARGDRMDSRLAVLARMEDSSPHSGALFLPGLLILHVNSVVVPFKSDEEQRTFSRTEIILKKTAHSDNPKVKKSRQRIPET
jgi:hypothetical protein